MTGNTVSLNNTFYLREIGCACRGRAYRIILIAGEKCQANNQKIKKIFLGKMIHNEWIKNENRLTSGYG